MNNKIITIDGPSASGKGTIARQIADILEFNYLDSGALYRIIAYIFSQINYNINAKEEIEKYENEIITQFNNSKILFTNIDNILLNDKNITSLIRSEEIGKIASILALRTNIRKLLLEWQRNCATEAGLVTDGRDMGTIIFPEAKCKIFLVANVEKRAERRYQQLIQQKKENIINFNDVLNDLKQRDERDMNRINCPLKPADDALIIDNTELSIEDTINKVLDYYRTL